MIRVELPESMMQDMPQLVRQLRKADIPVRMGIGEVRLCICWDAAGKRMIGKGTLHIENLIHERLVVFTYTPPVDKNDDNVIDVESRVVPDTLQIEHDD